MIAVDGLNYNIFRFSLNRIKSIDYMSNIIPFHFISTEIDCKVQSTVRKEKIKPISSVIALNL